MPFKNTIPKSMMWAVIASTDSATTVWGLFMSYHDAQVWIDGKRTQHTKYKIAPYYPKAEKIHGNSRVAQSNKRR